MKNREYVASRKLTFVRFVGGFAVIIAATSAASAVLGWIIGLAVHGW